MAASVSVQRVVRLGNVLLRSGTLFIRPGVHKTVRIKHQLPGNMRFYLGYFVNCISLMKQQFI